MAWIFSWRTGREAGLSPRLSNLVAYRTGFSYQLLEKPEDGETLAASLFLSLYRKDVTAGPISNPGAARADDDVGNGLDLSIGWKPAHDLTVGVQAGWFEPGDAFVTRDTSRTIFTSVTYSY